MDFVPNWSIFAALAAAFSIPVVLWISGRTSMRGNLGARLKTALAASWALWLTAHFASTPSSLWDFLAGAAILTTAAMIAFNVWSLLSWGFMLSLLLALSRQDQPISADEWIEAHSGGTYRIFSRNRLNVLLGMGLAQESEGRVSVASVLGRLMARAALFASVWYGVKPSQ